MTRLALLLALAATPLAAQEAEPPSLMERGLRLLMEGLAEEMEPALRDLQSLADDAQPMMEALRDQLGEAFGGLDAYHPPEVLENGDILIRRKRPGDDVEVETNPDGSIDL
ncbi:hypothetical protein JQC91_00410 [Jannaschia sp. Os4]|uniref:hypothetical protein n=1 Tax=Jannaschia sp. Os4 TaxID=2807617 RepID=UPI001939C958|nr:hypothetical protein [Jannaschia sp. Os4]MBM2574752.1 hypothetical protein [Jannaschia sp. Os4]